MKKIILLVFLLTLSLSVVAQANNTSTKLEGYGGLVLNTFDEDETQEDMSIGILGGIRNWVSTDLALGGEFEYTSFEVQNNNDISLTGFLATATYKLGDNIYGNGALGLYSQEYDYGRDSSSNSNIGFKLGVETKVPLENGMHLSGRANYRNVIIENTDFGGLQFGAALVGKF